MAQGKVKWFNRAKGYGLIIQDGGQDIFVHHSSIRAKGLQVLMSGEQVIFDIYEGQKDLIAKNVVRLNCGSCPV